MNKSKANVALNGSKSSVIQPVVAAASPSAFENEPIEKNNTLSLVQRGSEIVLSINNFYPCINQSLKYDYARYYLLSQMSDFFKTLLDSLSLNDEYLQFHSDNHSFVQDCFLNPKYRKLEKGLDKNLKRYYRYYGDKLYLDQQRGVKRTLRHVPSLLNLQDNFSYYSAPLTELDGTNSKDGKHFFSLGFTYEQEDMNILRIICLNDTRETVISKLINIQELKLSANEKLKQYFIKQNVINESCSEILKTPKEIEDLLENEYVQAFNLLESKFYFSLDEFAEHEKEKSKLLNKKRPNTEIETKSSFPVAKKPASEIQIKSNELLLEEESFSSLSKKFTVTRAKGVLPKKYNEPAVVTIKDESIQRFSDYSEVIEQNDQKFFTELAILMMLQHKLEVKKSIIDKLSKTKKVDKETEDLKILYDEYFVLLGNVQQHLDAIAKSNIDVLNEKYCSLKQTVDQEYENRLRDLRESKISSQDFIDIIIDASNFSNKKVHNYKSGITIESLFNEILTDILDTSNLTNEAQESLKSRLAILEASYVCYLKQHKDEESIKYGESNNASKLSQILSEKENALNEIELESQAYIELQSQTKLARFKELQVKEKYIQDICMIASKS